MTRRRRRGPLRGFAGRAFLAGALAVAAWLAIKVLTWPNVAGLAKENPKSSAFISRYERERRRHPEMPELRWSWKSWNEISANLKRAVVVAEDAEFFAHDGFSEREIKAALEKAVRRRELPRGASTITQQLAKNLWLSPSRSPLRKAEEALLTRQLEEQLTKRRILELYLNLAEFGPGVYGAEAASRAFYRKSASALSVREAAALAASLPKPAAWHPGSRSRHYNRRTSSIERMTMRAGFLGRYLGGSTTEEVAIAEREPRGGRPAGRVERNEPARTLAKPSTSKLPSASPAPSAPPPPETLDPTALEPAREPAVSADTSTSLEEMMRELKAGMDSLRREEELDEADPAADGE